MAPTGSIPNMMARLQRMTARALTTTLDFADEVYQQRQLNAGEAALRPLREQRRLLELAITETENLIANSRLFIKQTHFSKRGEVAMMWIKCEKTLKQIKQLLVSTYADMP